jgi:asparagine synthase (glutamine-hydrolysing)
MCGIVGVLHTNGAPVDRVALRRAATSIAHRGPDDEGEHIDGPAGLAHRRLSIIDLSPAARGPMTNEDETVWLTYNGEIYNFKELRRLLMARGHAFRSHSDGEVLVHGWEEWGEQVLDRLNGIFAFGIWDVRRGELVLARDRFGAKPLYVWEGPDGIVFGSEVKALLAYRGSGASLSLPALQEYLTFQNVYGEQTLFEGVKMLPAGSCMRVSRDGTIRRRTYFDPVPEPIEGVDEAALAEELRHRLTRSVERQLVADVPVGAYLSGGMDSASLVTLAGRLTPHIHTFTVGFDVADASPLEVAADERSDAEQVARQVGTEHYEAVLHAGDMARVLPQLVWHLEDLRAGTCYQNFYVARLASRFTKVVLAGTGGDELFAGYPWRYARLECVTDRRSFADSYYDYWCRLVPDDEKRNLFTDAAWEQLQGATSPRERFEQVVEHLPDLAPIDLALYFEQRTFLHGLLVVEDKLSMAHGLEARVPFLDNELVDFALRIPGSVRNGSSAGKKLLRDAARGLLPDALVEKRKQGFSPPDRTWYQGRNLTYVREVLLDATPLSRGLFRPAHVERVINEHANGDADHRLLIWSLLCLEWWQQHFVDNWASSAAKFPSGTRAGWA